jgi:hypothetical protein
MDQTSFPSIFIPDFLRALLDQFPRPPQPIVWEPYWTTSLGRQDLRRFLRRRGFLRLRYAVVENQRDAFHDYLADFLVRLSHRMVPSTKAVYFFEASAVLLHRAGIPWVDTRTAQEAFVAIWNEFRSRPAELREELICLFHIGTR